MSNELLIPETLTGVEVFANDDNPERHLELIKKVQAEAKALVPDISTPEGRDAIKSMAYKVSRSKTALDDLGKELTENARKTIDAVNAKRKRIRDELDSLRDEVRKPLTEWEAAEEERVSSLKKRLEDLGIYTAMQMSQYTSDQIEKYLGELDALARFDWQEFKEQAEQQWSRSSAHLNKILEERKKYEAEQAELERLRKEQAEKDAELEKLRKEKAEREAEEERKQHEAQKLEAQNEPPQEPKKIDVENVDVGKKHIAEAMNANTPIQKNLEPQLIIGFDPAKEGSETTSMILRYGQHVHHIPEPFAKPLYDMIVKLEKQANPKHAA